MFDSVHFTSRLRTLANLQDFSIWPKHGLANYSLQQRKVTLNSSFAYEFDYDCKKNRKISYIPNKQRLKFIDWRPITNAGPVYMRWHQSA